MTPFPIPVVAAPDPDSIEAKIERAEGVLTRVLQSGAPVCVSWSAGKDSSAVLNLLLSAAARLRASGAAVPAIVVTHADTGIENPSMVGYAREEMKAVRAFAAAHGLRVDVEIAEPNLTNRWAVRVIGGRALPPFPGTHRDCSVDWKVEPMRRLRKAVLKRLQAAGGPMKEPIVLLGTRYEESSVRSAAMRERGESDVEVRRGVDEKGKPSHLFLSPIAWWTTDDVWEYLGTARAGAIPAYSTFEETFRMYADAMGSSCVIVAVDMNKALKSSKACGARHGCSLCTAVGKDASMENMLATDERYGYMRGLNRLRNFLTATRWDMGRRSWVGRTLHGEHVRIAPDAYSPAMMEELLRYCLTLDVREIEAARRDGVAPRFQLVDAQQLFAIDALWSLQAFHRPFHALKIYRDVYELGHRYDVPDAPTSERPAAFEARYLHVGERWDQGDVGLYTGLRSALSDFASLDREGCMGNRALKSGQRVLDVDSGDLLSFDEEAMGFVLDEIPELLARHHGNPNSSRTHAYLHYAQLGMMEIKNGSEARVDAILRRSFFKERHGLAGQIDAKSLWDRALTAEAAGLVAPASRKGSRKRGAAGSLSVTHESFAEDAQAVAAP